MSITVHASSLVVQPDGSQCYHYVTDPAAPEVNMANGNAFMVLDLALGREFGEMDYVGAIDHRRLSAFIDRLDSLILTARFSMGADEYLPTRLSQLREVALYARYNGYCVVWS
jgi:hypothetical protein